MIIEIKVIANASENKIIGFEEDVLKIKCTATPEKGKANVSVIKMLAKYYQVPKSCVQIIRGKTHSKKTVKIIKNST